MSHERKSYNCYSTYSFTCTLNKGERTHVSRTRHREEGSRYVCAFIRVVPRECNYA